MDEHKQKTLMTRQVFKSSYDVKEQRMRNINLFINLGILSHELRTPLTAILGLAKELSKQKQDFTPQQRTYIEGICHQGDRLFDVLNRLSFNQHQNAIDDNDVCAADIAEKTTVKVNLTKTIPELPILIIEDEPIIQRVHCMMLENLGYRVDVAKDGEEALAFYSTCQYAAILTDINMPGISGIEVSAEIRRLEASVQKRIPIIALTADITEETCQACLAAGVDEVAIKPIKSDTLNIIFQRYLGKK